MESISNFKEETKGNDKQTVNNIIKTYSKLSLLGKKIFIAFIKDDSGMFLLNFIDTDHNIASKFHVSNELTNTTIIGLIYLLFSLIGNIINLPSFLILDEQSFYLKITWRYMTIFVFVLPVIFLNCIETTQCILSLIFGNFISILLLSILHTAYIYLLYLSAEKTYIIHTLLICSISKVFITLWKAIRSLPLTKIEFVAIGFCLLGVYLCYWESNSIFLLICRE